MLELLKLSKTFTHKRLTASGLIISGPALVFSAHLVAGTGGAATAAIYDSHGVFGQPVIDLSAIQSSTDVRVFIPPIYFDQGVYGTLGSNVTSLSIHLRKTRNINRPSEPSFFRSLLPSWLGGSAKETEKA